MSGLPRVLKLFCLGLQYNVGLGYLKRFDFHYKETHQELK